MNLTGPITIQGTTSSSIWFFKTVVTETSADPTTRESKVKVEHFLATSVSGSYFAGSYSLTFEVDDQKYTQSLYKNSGTLNANQYVSLGSYTFTVNQTTTPLTISVKGKFSTSQFNPSSASSEGEVTLSTLHQAPIPSLDSIEEENEILINVGVTGDVFVPYLSKKVFNISAETYDNAAITEYWVANNTKVYPISETSPVRVDFTQNELLWGYDSETNLPISPWNIYVRDDTGSRGRLIWRDNTVIPYEKPNLIPTASSIKRNGQTSGKARLNLTGTFYNNLVGTTQNTVTLSFKYWRSYTTEPETYNVIPTNVYTINGNNLTISNWDISVDGAVIEDLDKSYNYKFKIKAVDSFGSSSEIELTCPKGEWLRAIFKDRIDFKKITQNGIPVETKPVTIYDNLYGESGSLEFDSDISNVEYIEIFYHNNTYGDLYSSVKIFDPIGKNIELRTVYPNMENNRMYVLSTYYTCSTTGLTYVSGYGLAISGESIYGLSQDTISITKVICCYKEEE